MEKLNDDCRRLHLRRSNKWDAAKDVLSVGKRIEDLASNCERTKRQYVKQDQNYWHSGILESRSKRQRVSTIVPAEANNIDIDNLSVEEIKQMLSNMGGQY